MSKRPGNYLGVTVGLAVVMIVAVVVVVPVVEDVDEEQRVAEAYCYQVYGDASIDNARVIGGHGGLHCAANTDDPHLHDVTEEAKSSAYALNRSGVGPVGDDGLPVDRVYRPWYNRGATSSLIMLALLVAVIAIAAIAVQVAR